ncbi:hypothetical protein [Salinibacter altiplanensis]|uniref:hypothetical protein n=1 Tax=Salinibacter altiplanensis TaxID=1803181 RepID=UPI000C9F6479|nr:hypothetical protein [Salinibacter altiplanensis]
MSQLEYLIVLVSILVGLGLADLTESLRDLVLPETNVQWHGLPVAWAVIVLGYVLTVWWTFFRLLRTEMWHHPVAFLPILLTVLTLYLLCALALPDADREEASYVTTDAEGTTIDLETFYLSKGHRRWFFGTAAIFSLLFFATFNGAQFYEGMRSLKSAAINTLITFPTFVIPQLLLAALKRKWVHWALTLYSFGWTVFLLFDVATALTGMN